MLPGLPAVARRASTGRAVRPPLTLTKAEDAGVRVEAEGAIRVIIATPTSPSPRPAPAPAAGRLAPADKAPWPTRAKEPVADNEGALAVKVPCRCTAWRSCLPRTTCPMR